MPPPTRLFSSLGGAVSRDPHRHQQLRSFVDARIKWVRDRGLDHAVEKEKHLLPFHNVKDLLLSSNSTSPPSLPLSSISSAAASLRLPFRAMRFLRLFPAAFTEKFVPPHTIIRATPDLVSVHEDEQRAFSESRAETADRLLRLLMLCPARRLPLSVIERLRFDLGLPRDFARSLLPDYPDYFQLSPAADGSPTLDLELVCYSKTLAISAMERYAERTGGYKMGAPLAFHLSFPSGFDLEKKVRNWLNEWQKLPYISPYEDTSHLAPKSDIAEKWTVSMLHEVLCLLVPKKTEKENLILLSRHLGLSPGFRKVITHHPGIFYVSNKLRTQTVVLREAYSRDRLVVKHPLMGLRYQYIHLMHKGKEADVKKKDRKSKWRIAACSMNAEDGIEDEEEDDDEEEEEDGYKENISGGLDTENESDDDIVDENSTRHPMLRRSPV